MQKIIHGDCLDVMKGMKDNSIDFIVCDPPYGINFMSMQFDKFKDQPAFNSIYWKEALRICKPGSMLAAFGGDRTHHHLMLAIEQAGWTIRTCIYWITGQGFPKSHNFGKKLGPEWHGYGTALKPSVEIIVLAMKPLDVTFTQNAEKWGVGGINIDFSRVGIEGGTKRSNQSEYPKNEDGTEDRSQHWARTGHNVDTLNKGRWPSNLILDEESAEQLDQMTRITKSPKGIIKGTKSSGGILNRCKGNRISNSGHGDSGGASRFFYCAKVSASERNQGNIHPTLKPISLMKYIIKLLAPPGNPICLDPFAGSGSTLIAAKELGINAIGIEKEKIYCEIAEKRIIISVGDKM